MTIPDPRPAVVLLHSSMSSRSQWQALSAAHGDRYRFIAPDLLGYGKAPLPDPATHAGFSLEHEIAAVLAMLATQLAADEPFHLVGHSYGGAIALRLARTRSGLVRSLAVFEPVAFHLLDESDPGRQEVRRVVAAIEAADTLERAARLFVDYWNGAGAFDALPQSVRERFAAQVGKVKLDFVALLGEPATLQDMAAIAVPSLVLTGRDGPLSTRAVAARLAAALPDASAAQTAGGHMAPITHAQDVNSAIIGFLSAHG